MNSMFRLVLAAFLLTVLVIVAVLAAGLFSGYSRSLVAWSRERQESVERTARQVLHERHRGSAEGTVAVLQDPALLPLDVPVFIYDQDRRLVASNRGVGRRRDVDAMPMLPIHDKDAGLLGYYAVGSAQFQADTANQALLTALTRAAIAALAAAIGLALVSAPLLARFLSRPAATVAVGIDKMATGDLAERIPETGAREIARIARSANLLALRLEEERHIRAQWVQDVAHDLRSPVAMIKAQLEAIADGVYQADSVRLNRLLSELGRVETLISDLDELMRLEAPELRLETAAFSAPGFLASLAERFADALAREGIVLEQDSRVATITGDENLLYRAVSNLLSNAIRHGGEGADGRRVVRCSVTSPAGAGVAPDTVRISVWNNGPVVPPEELPRVFDRLYRGEYARNTAGSGLGLTISRRIVLLHRGTIAMDSAAGQGTTVTIDLPQR